MAANVGCIGMLSCLWGNKHGEYKIVLISLRHGRALLHHRYNPDAPLSTSMLPCLAKNPVEPRLLA